MTKLRVMLRRIWDAKSPPPPVSKRSWCAPLQPEDVRRRIMHAVAGYPGATLADLGDPAAGPAGVSYPIDLPVMAGEVEPATARKLREHFDVAGWDITVRLTKIAQELAGEVLTELKKFAPADRPSVSSREVSEWATAIVARPYRTNPGLPDPDYLGEATAAFWRTRSGPGCRARADARLSDAEFVDTYASVYDELWKIHGEESPRELCPTKLGLGRLRRPPLTTLDSSWRSGTDRSVLSRYHRYFHRRAWTRNPAKVAETAGLDPDQHVSTRLLGADPDSLARLELRRACAPVGLLEPAHHALIRAMARAFAEADMTSSYDSRNGGPGAANPRPQTLGQWQTVARVLPTEDDPDLVAAVVVYAQTWARWNPMAEDFVKGTHDRLLTWSVQVELGVLRRLWHLLHGREVEWEAPFLRAEAVRLVRGAFTHHMTELLDRPIKDARDEDDPAPDPDPGPILQDDPRRTATFKVLGPALMKRLIELMNVPDEQWRQLYLDALTGRASRYLDPEEFRRWVAENLRDDDAPGGC